MATQITLTAADGHAFAAYRADPEGAPRGAIVVVQEIFGVNKHIRAVTDSFAADGYVAVAPAFFDRAKTGVELDYTPDGMTEGRKLAYGLDWNDTVADVSATAQALKQYGKVGLVGYCWGGSVAWLSACRNGLDCAVGYYGGRIIDFNDERPNCPTMLHFGDLDKGIPVDDVEAIKAAHPEVAVHRYAQAEHGFNCDLRASYHAESAKIARERTDAFFREHVG